MKPPTPVVVATVALWTVVLATSACPKAETPERQIRRALDELVAGLEAGDAPRAAEILDEDYLDAAKRTKKTMRQIAFVALRRGPLLVALQEVQPTIQGDAATVRVSALAVQGSATLQSARDLLPTNARRFDVTLTMRKLGDRWRIRAIDGDGLGSFTFD